MLLTASRIIMSLGALIAVGVLIGGASPAAARDCSPAGIAEARREFKEAYDKKDYDAADAWMTSLWNDCVANLDGSRRKDIDPVLRARLSNDAALLAHRRGDDDTCLQDLMAYVPPTKRPTPELAKKLPPDLQRAILRFNYGPCRPYCDTHGGPIASCESIRATAQLEKMVEGGLAERHACSPPAARRPSPCRAGPV